MKNLPQLLLEAERAFDEKFPEGTLVSAHEDWSYKAVKSFLRETLLSILSEAERATEVRERKGWSQYGVEHWESGFEECRQAVKSLQREWRGNLK